MDTLEEDWNQNCRRLLLVLFMLNYYQLKHHYIMKTSHTDKGLEPANYFSSQNEPHKWLMLFTPVALILHMHLHFRFQAKIFVTYAFFNSWASFEKINLISNSSRVGFSFIYMNEIKFLEKLSAKAKKVFSRSAAETCWRTMFLLLY